MNAEMFSELVDDVATYLRDGHVAERFSTYNDHHWFLTDSLIQLYVSAPGQDRPDRDWRARSELCSATILLASWLGMFRHNRIPEAIRLYAVDMIGRITTNHELALTASSALEWEDIHGLLGKEAQRDHDWLVAFISNHPLTLASVTRKSVFRTYLFARSSTGKRAL